MTMQEKYERLQKILKEYGSIAVAFSGGVDSTFLLAAAQDAVGAGAFAVFADSPVVMSGERTACGQFCRERHIRLLRVPFAWEDLKSIWSNPTDRCYHCKKLLFTKMKAAIGTAVLADGTNADDLSDYRPGLRALKELNVRSPLLEAGYTKHEIRAGLKSMGIPLWDRPAYACLASRIPYGERITAEKLEAVDRAETVLRNADFVQVRVRCVEQTFSPECLQSEREDEQGNAALYARVEVLPEEVPRLQAMLEEPELLRTFAALGFCGAEADPRGYRRGSLNEGLHLKK